MRVLIATDGSSHSDVAVQMGLKLCWFTNCTPTLFMVARRQSDKPYAKSVLTAGKETLKTAVSDIPTIVRIGHTASEIVREATIGRYNLLIIGQRPEYGMFNRIMGTNASYILRNAPCPVLIAKGNIGPLFRILLCEGGASPSLMSRLMTTLPSLLHDQTSVSVLHVMSQISVGSRSPDWQLHADALALIQAQTYEGDLLNHDVQVLQQTCVQQEPLVRHGLVVDEILAEASRGEYGLVVIGAHRIDNWERLLLDDLAQQIVARLDRPILVMR